MLARLCVAGSEKKKGGKGANKRKLNTPAASINLEESAPRGFVCPITLSLMKDPVIAADGHSCVPPLIFPCCLKCDGLLTSHYLHAQYCRYERTAIEKWLREQKQTSPLTNLHLPHSLLIANHALKSSIDDYNVALAHKAAANTKLSTSKKTSAKSKKPSSSPATSSAKRRKRS